MCSSLLARCGTWPSVFIHRSRAFRESSPRQRVSISFRGLQRLVQLELPYSAIGLVWNSMVSVAGDGSFSWHARCSSWERETFGCRGWALILQTAAGTGNYGAITWGLLTMVAIIVATDQLIWRPIIAWSDKFKFEQVESATRVSSPLLHLLRHSRGLQYTAPTYDSAVGERHIQAVGERR